MYRKLRPQFSRVFGRVSLVAAIGLLCAFGPPEGGAPDVSRADAPAKLISEAVIPAQVPPVAFSLVYDPSQVSSSARIAVSARVEVDGQLRFINDSHIAAINDGPTQGVEVLVKGVAP